MLTTVALVLLAGCGIGGAEGGGSEHLPTSGAGPYGKPEASSETPVEEPYVIVEATADLRDPAALAAEGGGFDIWYTRAPNDGSATEIWYAHLPSIRALPDVGPERALAALEDWEADTVEAPSVVDLGGGRRVMYYQGGGDDTPGIGRATSDDGGRTWTHQGLVLSGGLDPSALVIEGHTLLYYGLPDGSGIGLAEADPGGAFVPSSDSILVAEATKSDAFDHAWIGEPDAVGGITAAGQKHIGLFYVGRSSSMVYAIGHADSWDGRMFMRFFSGEAILEAELPDERGPAAVLYPDQGVLFFTQQRTSHTVIAVATSP